MLKPVMPYVMDITAHILFFHDHMMTVHAHHGKYHVHAELAEAAKNDQADKSTSTVKKDRFENDQLLTEIPHLITPAVSIKWPVIFSLPTAFSYTNQHFPPPKA